MSSKQPTVLGSELEKVSYRISHFPKDKTKQFEVQVHQQQQEIDPNDLLLIYGGRPSKIMSEKDYSIDGVHAVFPNGYLGIVLSAPPSRASEEYYGEATSRLKFPAELTFEPDMYVVARMDCKKHRMELCRGLVKEDKGESVIIKLVDNFGVVEVKKEELFAMTCDFFSEPFRAFVAQLDIEMENSELFSHEAVDAAITKCVIGHRHELNKARFKCLDNGIQKIVGMKLNGTQHSFTELVLAELIAGAAGKFPTNTNETANGFLVHAEKNGNVFIQLEEASHVLEAIANNINTLENCKHPRSKDELRDGDIYLAPFMGELYRAQIIDKMVGSKSRVKVQYIDFGNQGEVEFSDLSQGGNLGSIYSKLPPLCFQVNLKWVGEIVDIEGFKKMSEDIPYEIQIRNEKVNGVQSVVLVEKVKGGEDKVLNKLIIREKGFAIKRKSADERSNRGKK